MSWNRVSVGRALIVTIAVSHLAGAPLQVPFFAQKKNGCGAASAAMVLHYWSEVSPGRTAAPPSPEESYRRLFREDLKGIRLSDIRHYLEEMRLRAFTFRGTWADVDEQLAKGRPVIAGLRPGSKKPVHFVVVVGAEDGRVWLNDPTRRKASQMALDKFEKQWTMADRWILLAIPHPPE